MAGDEFELPRGPDGSVFCYGDGGGNELDPAGRPKLLNDAHKRYFDPEREPFQNDRDSYAPLVWQCRYGGVEVPDALWQYVELGKNEVYSDNHAEDLPRHKEVFPELDAWTDRFASFIERKGKVEPNKYRAFGYNRLATSFMMSGSRGGTYVCASVVRA